MENPYCVKILIVEIWVSRVMVGVHIKLKDEQQNVNLATKIEELLTKFCSQNAIQEN